MRKSCAVAVVATLACATWAGPVAAADREHQQIMADIRMLQEQTQQLAIALVGLADALNKIDARFDEQAEASRRSFADQKLIVDNMGADLRVIRERADETNVRLASLDQELEALRNAIPPPAPMAPPVDLLGLTPAGPTNPAGPPPTAPPAVPSAAGLSPSRMYDQAFADYGAGQWTLAIEGFQAFLRTFPMSDQADDAQYYIGETYYLSGRYQDAVTAYNQVIQRYPESNSSPAAYFKRGLALERLGDVPAARTSWEFVTTTYPESDAGRLAKQALDRTAAKKP